MPSIVAPLVWGGDPNGFQPLLILSGRSYETRDAIAASLDAMALFEVTHPGQPHEGTLRLYSAGLSSVTLRAMAHSLQARRPERLGDSLTHLGSLVRLTQEQEPLVRGGLCDVAVPRGE